MRFYTLPLLAIAGGIAGAAAQSSSLGLLKQRGSAHLVRSLREPHLYSSANSLCVRQQHIHRRTFCICLSRRIICTHLRTIRLGLRHLIGLCAFLRRGHLVGAFLCQGYIVDHCLKLGTLGLYASGHLVWSQQHDYIGGPLCYHRVECCCWHGCLRHERRYWRWYRPSCSRLLKDSGSSSFFGHSADVMFARSDKKDSVVYVHSTFYLCIRNS
ncbi:hypothetical protein OBBRIDRAFT_346309 [Obba rivulosa]|uniref:Secreted protein n=1 Tax=Obba rivulosa TaxID=1052685 RepID=A0A8E2AMK7_9APHY|nr:hypothetical protein OBBRIDRAFT_346309 [Obba rivulosa]